jgi:hypothetical protein
MKKFILLASFLFLTACFNMDMSSDSPAASTVSNVYTSQFPEVPIPMLMEPDPKNSLTTVNSAGEKLGRENFKGNMEASNLAAHMVQNLTSQSWSLVGAIQGEKTLQLYQKDSRYLIIFIESGTFNTNMQVWVVNHINNFSLPNQGNDPFNFGDTPAFQSAPLNDNFNDFGANSVFSDGK